MAPSSAHMPPYGPQEYFNVAEAAVIVPSLLAPILTSIEVALVGPEARKTSSRDMTSLTGRPALRDSASATGSAQICVLPPKPPPISDEVTRSFETSRPSSAAHCWR